MNRDAELHAWMLPHLRMVTAQMRLRNLRLVLDVACGSGQKRGWLAEMLAPAGIVVGVDLDRAALAQARMGPVGTPLHPVCGDALMLPLRSACADLVWCSAALGLFADTELALRDMRRVLRSGGTLVVVTGAYLWVRTRRWPPDLAAMLAQAYAAHLNSGGQPVRPADGLDEALGAQLMAVGFASPLVRAFLPGVDSRHLLAAELLLTDWPSLRSRVAALLTADDLRRCEDLATHVDDPDPELAPVLLVARAVAGGD